MGKVKVNRKIKKLKKGDKFVVSNVLFYGDSPKPLPHSLPTIKSLYKMMKRNKKLVISIEGHTNGCSSGRPFSKKLSESRALTVVNYLVGKNIEVSRTKHKGWGCSKMLYPENSTQHQLNRRVEIKIIDF